MNIQILDPTQYPGWDDLILQHPEASFFHSSAWARVLSESYRYTPFYFAVMDGHRLSALLPVMEVKSILTGTRGVSLPFTDYCDPIMNESVSFKELFDQVADFGRRRNWRYLELRGDCRASVTRQSQVASRKGSTTVSRESLSDLSSLTPDASRLAPNASLLPFTSYLGHIADLAENEEEIFYGLKDSARRNIKKANREGVEAGVLNTLDSVKEFYRLNCLTRRDHGLPPQPLTFFEKVHEYIIGKGHGFVALASYRGKNIAGAVFFHFGQKALYKYGASDRRYQHVRANNLAMWEAIKWYSQRGFKNLHFGRTEPENEGLVQFKSSWGTTEQQIHYYRYDLRKGVFVSGSSKVRGFHNKILRNIPIPILNKIGSLLYRHVG